MVVAAQSRIVLRFVRYSSITSSAIELDQRDGWATHVESVTPDGQHWLGSQTPEGVLARPVGYDSSSVIVRQQFVTLPDATPEQAKEFYSFLTAQEGTPYDYLAIAGLALGRNWRAGHKWFCSELIAAGLEHCGYWKLASETNHVDPRDLYLLLSARFKIDP